MADTALSWQGLSIGFDAPLLQVSDYALAPGDALVLLGPNGAGKSTFLKTICGILKPITGTISPSFRSPVERSLHIAYVPQSEPIEFGWTVRDFVGLSRVMRGGIADSPADIAAAESAMAHCDVMKFADQPVARLSGGEQQRVRIARGLAQETPIIALDEPTSHLDIAHALDILGLIREVMASGKTVLLSLHDTSQALSLDAHFGFAVRETLTIQNKKPSSSELEEVYGVPFSELNGMVLPTTYCRTTGSK